MAQSSFYSVSDRRLHFGLGSSSHVDLEIHWTNGLIERFPGVEANQLVTVKEGQRHLQVGAAGAQYPKINAGARK